LAPIHKRIFLTVSDPNFGGASGGDRRGQPIPIGVIRDDEGKVTPCWRARARTRIQPDAKALPGSGNRRRHTAPHAVGGQKMMLPPSSALLAPRTSSTCPRLMARLS